MERRKPKYKVGDRVKFNFDGGTWEGEITEIYWFPYGWKYRIYDFDHHEDDIIGKEE